ncbi:protein FAM200A-like [Palaemon carinicauda]|uniref:protein FAM200A-like n=1 Tax=Palaemon carinicauda TaxID=392227 RepID=UPI0035B5AF00
MFEEMGTHYENLLYHTEVCWLSREKVLVRVAELRELLHIFLEEKRSSLANLFNDELWVENLCYLADIFGEVNARNLKLQGRQTTSLELRENIVSFCGKLQLWTRRVGKGIVAQFPTLDAFLDKVNSEDILNHMKTDIRDHLTALLKSLHKYFPDLYNTNNEWGRNFFNVSEDIIPDEDCPAKEEFITLRTNNAWKLMFEAKTGLDTFWISRLQDIPTLASRAVQILIGFSTTYLCEQAFFTVLGMKTKQRNRINVSSDARVALSVTKPRIEKIAQAKQAQPSH